VETQHAVGWHWRVTQAAIVRVFYPNASEEAPGYAIHFLFSSPGEMRFAANLEEKAFADAVIEPMQRAAFRATHKCGNFDIVSVSPPLHAPINANVLYY